MSGLRSWVLKNEKRRKILVMHHPLQDLSEYAQREIEAMVNGEQIDFIISGHTHDYFNHPRTTDTGTKYITLPPLFESEKSLNGYMLMSIGTKQELLTLKYRQWSKYNNKFLVGSDLVGNDNGLKEYLPQDKAEDFITKTLHGSLQKSLSIYGLTPTWRNRVCIETPYSRDTENIIKFDYIDIMNMSHNVQIQAPRQFGLTCYARYLAFIAWNNYKIPYVYHNFKDLNIHKIEETINEDARFYKVSADDIPCLIGISASDQSGSIFHATAWFMKYAASMAHPCPAGAGTPFSEKIACLTSGRVTVVKDFIGADVILPLQLAQCFLQSLARPDFRFPIVIIF